MGRAERAYRGTNKIHLVMRNHIRLCKELNRSIMPKGWDASKDKISCFTLYVSEEEKEKFIKKFSMYRDRCYKAEVICFMLSNYLAYASGKQFEISAIKVWKYGIKNPRPDGYVNYSIGAIPVEFMKVVTDSLKSIPFRFKNELVYHVVSAFYNAPTRLVDEMINRINEIKHPTKRNDRAVILQAVIPENEYQMVKGYAIQNGMNICDLLRVVLRAVCMSKRDRKYDDSPIGRVFNLYRILKQKGEPFIADSDCRILFVEITGDRERYYLMKLLRRRGITKTEMLRKAVRTLNDVVTHRNRLEKKITIETDVSEEEDTDYWYEQMARRDFARSIYV